MALQKVLWWLLPVGDQSPTDSIDLAMLQVVPQGRAVKDD